MCEREFYELVERIFGLPEVKAISAMKAPEPMLSGVSALRWRNPRRDDRDGCDSFLECGGGVQNIVTVVTAVTGSAGESQGGITAGGDCRKAIQPVLLDFHPTENTCRAGKRPGAFPPCPTASDKV